MRVWVATFHLRQCKHTLALGLGSIRAPRRAQQIQKRQGWVEVTSAFAEMSSSAPGLSQTSQSYYHSFSNTPESLSDSESDGDAVNKPSVPQRRLSAAVDAPLPAHIAEPDATVKIIYTILGAATLLPWNGASCVQSFARNYLTCVHVS